VRPCLANDTPVWANIETGLQKKRTANLNVADCIQVWTLKKNRYACVRKKRCAADNRLLTVWQKTAMQTLAVETPRSILPAFDPSGWRP
jgi:hypothetical protein